MISERFIEEVLSKYIVSVEDADIMDANFSSKAYRLYKLRYKSMKFTLLLFREAVSIGLKASCIGGFSINIRDKVMLYNDILDTQLPVTVYFDRAWSSEKKILEKIRMVSEAIENFNFRTDEGLMSYANGLQLKVTSEDRIIDALELLYIIRKRMSLIVKKESRSLTFPEKFAKLVPYIPLAISDDSDRKMKVSQFTQCDIDEFKNAIEPYISTINEYISGFGDKPLSEDAIALGRLTELYGELD